MRRRQKLPIRYVMISITILCLMLIIITWETRTNVSPIEKSFAYVIVPIQKGVNVFGDWVIDKVNFVKNINELEAMNEVLTEEVDKLRFENKLLEQDKAELTRLRSLMELKEKYADYPTIGARVIGKDPGNWYNVFLIDKGTRDGLKVDLVVMAGSGLVGRIIEVGPNYSKVISIIDDASNVSAKVFRTSDLCIVRGDKKFMEDGLCTVEYLEESANVIEGDEIVTSHLGTIYPPGILIGTIKDIKKEPHELIKHAVLEPVVDFKHLEEVLVIQEMD